MKPESDEFVIAESDLEIINALQLNPRASWTQLSSVLDMDSTTIARRWRRLVSNGHSWVNAVAIGRTHIFGYLLIRTTQDAVADVGERLRELACAYLLARTEGEYEYFVGVVAADQKSLDALVCEHLAADPGILSIRSRVGVKVYRDGFSWEPGALGQAGRAQLATAAAPADPTVFRESDGALLEALGRDGRASYARLAAICGTNETAIRRRLAQLTASQQLIFRCDVSQQAVGSPFEVIFDVAVDGSADELGNLVSSWPEIRLLVATTGTANMLISVWLSSLAQSLVVEDRLRRIGSVRILDRRVSLYPMKRFGQLLGPNGVAEGHVPVAIWGADDILR
ncbi:Lrp/AsnC family transcriptional regulator [Rhodococcus sp. 24CO]|uniref:Lrp/AsnC family transcriptional regulator n=1 Tax=Rhodococcus sp. 24CO TaxID=3117460 RepID=UPI003D32863F